MTKSKALQIIVDLRTTLDGLPKARGLPKGKGFAATRTALKSKFYFLKLYKTNHNLRKLLVNQAVKDIKEYTIEVYKIRDREEAEKAEKQKASRSEN